MDLLQLAQHRFEQISPLLLKPIDQAASDEVETWLRDQVCPVASQLCKNRRFQRFARWSVDHLARGAKAPQRKLVEAVDDAMIECAKASVAAAAKLGLFVPIAGHDDSGGDACGPNAPFKPGSKGIPASLGQLSVIEWIAMRPFFDLVCVEEYFDGSRGLHLATSRIDCSDDFWRWRDPRVPLGDYVCRGMLLRIEYFVRRIEQTWTTCFDEAQRRGSEGFRVGQQLFSAKTCMDQAIALLRDACHKDNDACLRDACAALTQVYMAYSPNPKLDWFGLTKHFILGHAPGIHSVVRPPTIVTDDQRTVDGQVVNKGHRTERLCRPDVVSGIAGALDVVAPICTRPLDADELIEWLRQTKRLVMVDRRPRTVFWDHKPIEAKWDRRSTRWDFLWKVARRAQSGQSLDREEVTGPDAHPDRAKHRRSELSKDIPTSLDALIEDVRPRGYQLRLDPNEIELLTVDQDDQLVEVQKLHQPRP